MTIEQFKNNWQPQMDGYARFSFNLDLKELVRQIRTDIIVEISREVRFLYGNEYEKQILSVVIDHVFSELNRLHISYDSEENSVSTTYYDGTDDETTVDIVKGILKENFVKELKEENNVGSNN